MIELQIRSAQHFLDGLQGIAFRRVLEIRTKRVDDQVSDRDEEVRAYPPAFVCQ
jgi:hypothetical protein